MKDPFVQPERTQTETVIGILRNNFDGLALVDFAPLGINVPQHRVNEVLIALVRAKVALKRTVPVRCLIFSSPSLSLNITDSIDCAWIVNDQGGGGEYRLDETKYGPPSI
jgi:hypothetical protein